MWLPASANVVGEQTAREAVISRSNPANDGTETIILWRGAKGQERIVREESRFSGTQRGEYLRGQGNQGQRGSEEANDFASHAGKIR